jgi:uncharacterized protein
MKNRILRKVKELVKTIEPSAEIFLFGSRARNDNRRDSDWDFLILVDGIVDSKRTDHIRHALYEVEWETGQIISSIVKNRQSWYKPTNKTIPLHVNVEREGILL